MSQKNPLVTVYITNHNYEHYIEASVESLLQQTFHDYEVIIIDDGSTDNSRAIIEGYTDHEKVKVIFQQNKGLNVTNNIAMRTAKGKYIMRLDADDYLDPNALLVMVNLLEQDDELGLVFPDYYMVDKDGEVMNIEKRHHFEEEVTLFDQPAHGACTMIRREFLMKLNGYDERYGCQDGYELWVKFTNHFKVKNVNTPLFYYRQHGANLTSNENRILGTRAKIKADYLDQQGIGDPTVISIIPIRGNKNSKQFLAFEKLSEKYLIDWKIDESLKSKKVTHIVVTSPDATIGDYIQKQYPHTEKLSFVQRDIELARLNTNLLATIEHVLGTPRISDLLPKSVMIQALEFPFINAAIIDDAINTMEIFGTDSLISVRPDTSLFFQHHGAGMTPILQQDKFTKLEREALYRYTGGLSLSKTDYFTQHQKFIGGQVGHIVVDQKAAHGIFTQHDLKLAHFLAEQDKDR